MAVNYKLKTKPYEHQLEALDRSLHRDAYGFFMEMGTGKSKVLIDTCANLYVQGKISFALIIAPKGVYRNWVTKEIPDHFPDDIPHRVIRWVASPNKKQQEEMRSVKDRFDGLTFFVMNVESFSSLKGKTAGEWMARNFGKHGMIGLDESTTIKNHKAKRTKSLCKISKDFAYRRLLTGSPITKAPMDIYSQAEFLGPRLLGFDSYYAFQGRYCVTVRRSMGAHSFQQVVGYRNLDELTESIDSFSYRVLKEDCLDLPEKTFTARYVKLTKEQAAMYKRLKEDALLLFNNGEMVSTPQVITKMLRLQQVLSGHLMTDDGELMEFPSSRLDELLSILEETSGKAIIWSRFRNDIERITAALKKAYGDDVAASYYGDTADDERNRIVQDFQKPDHPLRFFVGNPATAGYGLTLTEANTVIYYANSFSLEHRLQSEDRVHRIGQKNPVTYVDLIAEGSIDEKIVESLRNKIDIGAAVLGEEAREWLKLTPKNASA
jgi:SNF2 family DNA or RNA helicase